MKTILTRFGQFTLGGISSFLIFAQAFAFEVSDEVKAKLETVLTKQGAEIHYFDGPHDLIGIGLTSRQSGQQMVAYAVPDGSVVLTGVAIEIATGDNLAAKHVAMLPKPDLSPVYNKLKESHFVSEGKESSTNEFFVFIDPKCPYCHKAYNMFLATIAEEHDVRVHYVPVGILGLESQNLSKEILGSDDVMGLELIRKMARREGHQFSAPTAALGDQQHERNVALFREFGFSAVPSIVSRVNGEVKIHREPLSKEAIIQAITVAKVDQLATAGE
ncbi:MAG: thioredoxin fold domain-containing protein [Pseudomonadales bacterium]|nr:thioredoxin fold domain-containing protein [Pseudomonadales bacterium]